MALPDSFLEEIRARVAMSGLLGRSLKLTRAGREFKACCPFHNEKTPSFTVNDEKGFGHCFGCGWHGDVFRWLMDSHGLPFMDAVKELAAEAGLEMPAPTPAAAERARVFDTVREALEVAQGVYVAQLDQAGAVLEYLAGRGIGPAEIAAFGIGYARGQDGSLRGRGIGEKLGRAAGLLVDGNWIGEKPAHAPPRELFWDRITIPIHDARGRLVGFGGRVWPGRRSDTPKFVNSPDSELFDKGRTLFNLHRASPAARPHAGNRLIVVEGYFDVVALARIGIAEAVAPMGTALTEAQLERCWRVHHRPVLLFDGDGAGRKAAVRACAAALPMLGPGRELAVALLPAGKDPDDLVRELGEDAAQREIEAMLGEAVGLHAFLFDTVAASLPAGAGPEAVAGVWAQLSELAGTIGDADTRAEYLGTWRARFERELSSVPAVAAAAPLHSIRRADDGDYEFPDSEGDSAKHLIQIVRRVLRLREDRRAITADLADVMKFAEAIGVNKVQIGAVVREIESDLAKGPGVREEAEMLRVLYRRTLGIRGPMNEAMLPQVVDARPKQIGAGARRKATTLALIEAGAMEV
jgi:DNA primase